MCGQARPDGQAGRQAGRQAEAGRQRGVDFG